MGEGQVNVGKYGQKIATNGTQYWEYVHKRSGSMSATAELLV